MADLERLTRLAAQVDPVDHAARARYWTELLRIGDVALIRSAVCDPTTADHARSAARLFNAKAHLVIAEERSMWALHHKLAMAEKGHRTYDASKVTVTLDGMKLENAKGFPDFGRVEETREVIMVHATLPPAVIDFARMNPADLSIGIDPALLEEIHRHHGSYHATFPPSWTEEQARRALEQLREWTYGPGYALQPDDDAELSLAAGDDPST